MIRPCLIVLVASLSVSAAAQEPLYVEWADHANDPKALIGDPVFVRTLFCQNPQQGRPMVCELTVVTVSRNGLPPSGECSLLLQAFAFRTREGRLRASWVGDTVEIEARGVFDATTKLSLRLLKSAAGSMIVEEESGVIVSKFGKDRMRATELVAYVKSTKGLEATREFSDVELNCSKLSVVAAKKAGK